MTIISRNDYPIPYHNRLSYTVSRNDFCVRWKKSNPKKKSNKLTPNE